MLGLYVDYAQRDKVFLFSHAFKIKGVTNEMTAESNDVGGPFRCSLYVTTR